MRVAAVALLVLFAAAVPAEARVKVKLKPVGHLRAKATTTTVRLKWRDRSHGETKLKIRRKGKRVRLRRNRKHWTDRHLKPGKRYRYVVRPCRKRRCAKGRVVVVRTKKRTGSGDGGSGGGPGGSGAFAGSPTIGGCPIFPKSNPWNTDVSHAALDTSHDYVGSLGSMVLWPDFGGAGAYGIPFVSVPRSQALVPVSFDEAEQSDRGPYPTPLNAPVEGGGDRHVLTLRQGDCKLFELYDASRQGAGWHAYSGAVFDLTSNALRPDTWTSADAAGLPMLPGLVRRDEVASGVIRHALRVTVPTTQHAYIHPATHQASSNSDPDQPPMGLRLRLRPDYNISGFGPQARVIAQALKTYGMLVADNAGSPRVYVSGAVDLGWDDDDLGAIKSIPASALQAVRTGPVIPGD